MSFHIQYLSFCLWLESLDSTVIVHVDLLLRQKNINVNVCSNSSQSNGSQYGSTALMLACRNGHEKIVSLLVQHPNINVNAQDSHGNHQSTHFIK